ncbi:MAG: helix-turn-helix transcriptional regulator [Bacteroidales bacterium]|nr:helix-turn-helix transcriptional regulator [Bacteroidales bacterium]
MNAENLSQAQFADELGVARASISHIIAGRNKPGFDFIENMSLHYPSLNLEWFITGKGRMYKSAAGLKPEPEDGFLFGVEEKEDEEEIVSTSTSSKKGKQVDNKKIITKILLFYSDGSFEEYTRQ